MIVLGIIVWVLCAGITYGVMMHIQPDEWSDDPILEMLICILAWPLFTVLGIVYIVIKQLSKIGLFVAGFLDKLFEEKEKKDA